jgi:hypothetical protein
MAWRRGEIKLRYTTEYGEPANSHSLLAFSYKLSAMLSAPR